MNTCSTFEYSYQDPNNGGLVCGQSPDGFETTVTPDTKACPFFKEREGHKRFMKCPFAEKGGCRELREKEELIEYAVRMKMKVEDNLNRSIKALSWSVLVNIFFLGVIAFLMGALA